MCVCQGEQGVSNKWKGNDCKVKKKDKTKRRLVFPRGEGKDGREVKNSGPALLRTVCEEPAT